MRTSIEQRQGCCRLLVNEGDSLAQLRAALFAFASLCPSNCCGAHRVRWQMHHLYHRQRFAAVQQRTAPLFIHRPKGAVGRRPHHAMPPEELAEARQAPVVLKLKHIHSYLLARHGMSLWYKQLHLGQELWVTQPGEGWAMRERVREQGAGIDAPAEAGMLRAVHLPCRMHIKCQ